MSLLFFGSCGECPCIKLHTLAERAELFTLALFLGLSGWMSA